MIEQDIELSQQFDSYRIVIPVEALRSAVGARILFAGFRSGAAILYESNCSGGIALYDIYIGSFECDKPHHYACVDTDFDCWEQVPEQLITLLALELSEVVATLFERNTIKITVTTVWGEKVSNVPSALLRFNGSNHD